MADASGWARGICRGLYLAARRSGAGPRSPYVRDQLQIQANERIAACGRLLQSGRLRGKPLGVAYGLRGLAFLDRGDIPHAIADFNRAVEYAPDFAPAYQNRGNA